VDDTEAIADMLERGVNVAKGLIHPVRSRFLVGLMLMTGAPEHFSIGV
jgi:hypothetical protein